MSDVDGLTKELYGLFIKGRNREFFPHIRNDYFKRNFESGQVLYEPDGSGRPIGLIVWKQYKRSGPDQVGEKGDIELCQIAVDPGLQGCGVGTRLFKRIEELARAKGAKRIGLSVRKSNVKACSFYEKMGMKVVGTKMWNEKGQPLPGLIYQIRLNGGEESANDEVPLPDANRQVHLRTGKSSDIRTPVQDEQVSETVWSKPPAYSMLEATNSKGIDCLVLYDEARDVVTYCTRGGLKCLDNVKCGTRKLGLKTFVHNVILELPDGTKIAAKNRDDKTEREKFYQIFKLKLKEISYEEYQELTSQVEHIHQRQ